MIGFLTKNKRTLFDLGAVIAVALMLLWPAFVNGEPFYMPDTSSYLRGADAAVHHVTGVRSAWTDEYFKRFPSASAASPALQPAETPVVLKGRSIYYGMLLYGAQWLGNFWPVAMLQALLIAIAIALTVGALRRALTIDHGPASVVLAGLLLAACTPAGFFASFLLPDVFGALALLAFGHLVFLWAENRRLLRVFWFGILVASALFHSSNFLLVGLLALAAALSVVLRIPASRVGLCAVAAALLISAAGMELYWAGVKHATGAAPIRPPFLAARIIADGPGYDYLREHCPTAKLVFCRAVRFKTRISDALLWSRSTDESIFQALTPSEQRLAAAQQSQFVLAVVKERPLDVIRSSIGAFFRQVTAFNLESFNYNAATVIYFNDKIPSPFIDHARGSKAFQNKMPVRFVEWTTVAAVFASLAAIVWTLYHMIRRSKRLPAPGGFLAFMILGVLLNAVICGAISTPKSRYQMRLIWVLPLAALASCNLRRREPLERPEEGIFASPQPEPVTS